MQHCYRRDGDARPFQLSAECTFRNKAKTYSTPSERDKWLKLAEAWERLSSPKSGSTYIPASMTQVRRLCGERASTVRRLYSQSLALQEMPPMAAERMHRLMAHLAGKPA
jgi:hypothetical protein